MHELTRRSLKRNLERIFALRLAPVLCAVLLASLATEAQAVNRCEDRNGRVTYTDEPCPPGARSARRVDDSAPVQVRDSTGRPANDGKDEAEPKGEATKGDAVKVDAAKSGATRTPADKGAPAAGELRAGRIVASSTPEQEMQRLDELRARQQRQCADLTRKVNYARADLQAASSSDRASAELALRRLQEEARLVCPR
jgi:hypothetical protein